MELTAQQQHVLEQIKAFETSDAAVFILKGYAGTGKTTMVKAVADYLAPNHEVTLMAPTGRAANVLTQKTKQEAKTIHRAIYNFDKIEVLPKKDIAETKPVFRFPINEDESTVFAIVDEASMISSKKHPNEMFVFGTDVLLDDLLTYIRPHNGGKVIFVGDPAQLPPVGEQTSQALSAAYFEEKRLKVMEAELTEVLRQTGDSLILQNAMQIRDLLKTKERSNLVFREQPDDVVRLRTGELLPTYFETIKTTPRENCVLISYSNRATAKYNKEIRRHLYQEDEPELRIGDMLMVTHNNYNIGRMNGEFVPVLWIGERVTQSAPVMVEHNGKKVRESISTEFIQIGIPDCNGHQVNCLLHYDFLKNEEASLSYEQITALFINFCMRNPELKEGSEEFCRALRADPYFNCLRAKYGYAVTGHKCQGGEWEKVFVDYSGRTGVSDDCLRWAYTATTRAQKTLYIANLPDITPFSKFRIEALAPCKQVSDHYRALGEVTPSPFHSATAEQFLHAKWMCINDNMSRSPYDIVGIQSTDYQEIYTIQTPDGRENYRIRYKKGGIFSKAEPLGNYADSEMVCACLNDERQMPLDVRHTPSRPIYAEIEKFIRAACDTYSIQITNIEELPDHSIVFYFNTSGYASYIKIYAKDSGAVSYAKPMSMGGQDDNEMACLLQEIQRRFQ